MNLYRYLKGRWKFNKRVNELNRKIKEAEDATAADKKKRFVIVLNGFLTVITKQDFKRVLSNTPSLKNRYTIADLEKYAKYVTKS